MNIIVRAYLDNNLGDDLMIRLLINRFPNYKFLLYTNSSVVSNTYKDYQNVKLRSTKDFRKDMKIVDAFITIGGSIFQIRTLKQHLSRLFKIIFLITLRLRKKKIATIGANLGPFLNKFSYKLAEWELRQNNLTTVRDVKSKKILESFRGIRNFHLADDIVYNLNTTNLEDKLGLGISTYRSTKESENNYENYCALAAIADNYIKKTGERVTLFAFDSETENDLVSAHHILNISEYKDKISIVPYLGNVDEFLDKFSMCKKMVAIRFHSAILADIFDIPFLPVIYSDKLKNFLTDNDFKGISIPLKSLNMEMDFDYIVDKIIEGKELFHSSIYRQNTSATHFDQLEKILQ